ncbi:MAG: PQQ-like beta-propeller repeat protein [Planctomycetales bacterium]|nr:PQQ-like beta-propeller repeat protein [Planctomycetales bacterium]
MNRLHVLCCSALVAVAAWCSSVAAENWPQWRGPNRTDISSETKLLEEWPEGGPPRVWLFEDCGMGYSGPAIVGDRLYILGARGEEDAQTEQLICVDVKTGKEVWSAEIGELLTNGWGDGPRGTPTVDGDFVYAISGKGNVVCVKASDGSVVWSKNMTDFGGSIPNWGYTESPLVDGDKVICTPGGDSGTMLALNKTNGETVWQSADWQDKAHYSSAIVAEHNGIRQYIQLTNESVAGINAENGAVVWKADRHGEVAVIPTPIFHDGYVYVTSGYNIGCDLFKIDDQNNATQLYDDEARKVMKNHHGGVVLIDGHIYGHSDRVGWLCQELETGKMVWREREALGKGSVTSADGMLYCMSEDDGDVALVKATTKGWQEVSRFRLEPQSEIRNPRGRIWTHPVIANGKLYLRDQDKLIAYDIEQK